MLSSSYLPPFLQDVKLNNEVVSVQDCTTTDTSCCFSTYDDDDDSESSNVDDTFVCDKQKSDVTKPKKSKMKVQLKLTADNAKLQCMNKTHLFDKYLRIQEWLSTAPINNAICPHPFYFDC
ncbi:hypothetical protein QTN25_006477 [Entamoeba marina]